MRLRCEKDTLLFIALYKQCYSIYFEVWNMWCQNFGKFTRFHCTWISAMSKPSKGDIPTELTCSKSNTKFCGSFTSAHMSLLACTTNGRLDLAWFVDGSHAVEKMFTSHVWNDSQYFIKNEQIGEICRKCFKKKHTRMLWASFIALDFWKNFDQWFRRKIRYLQQYLELWVWLIQNVLLFRPQNIRFVVWSK